MDSLVKDDVDNGWAWLVLIAVYSGMTFVSTATYMNGVYLVALLENYNEDLAKTSIIGALHGGLLCLLGPVVSVVMDIYSCRICIVFGGVLLSFSYFISFFANSIDMLIFTFGIIGGIGNSFAFIPFSVIMAYYFRKWRNIVISLSQTTAGLSMFIASPFVASLLDIYGLKGNFLIVSGFVSHICVCGLICIANSEEMKVKQTKTNERMIEEHQGFSNKVRTFSAMLREKISCNLVTNVPLVLFLLSTCTWNVLLSASAMYLPKYVLNKNLEESAIATVMTIFGLGNTLSRFLAALTVCIGRIDSLMLHVVMLGMVGIIAVLLPLYSEYSYSVLVFTALCGFFTGGPNSLMIPITIKIMGMERLSAANGLLFFSRGVGGLAGPLITGILFQIRGSYKFSFMILGFVLLTGSFLGLLAFSKIKTKNDTDGHSIKEESIETNLNLLVTAVCSRENSIDISGNEDELEQLRYDFLRENIVSLFFYVCGMF